MQRYVGKNVYNHKCSAQCYGQFSLVLSRVLENTDQSRI